MNQLLRNRRRHEGIVGAITHFHSLIPITVTTSDSGGTANIMSKPRDSDKINLYIVRIGLEHRYRNRWVDKNKRLLM